MRRVRLPFVLGLGFAVAGCVGPRQYRWKADPAPGDPRSPDNHAFVEIDTSAAPYQLFFIEVDDQGILWDRSHANAALDRIRATVLPATQGVLMLTFVHGWQNNAAPDNDNVQTFRGTLSQLSRMEAQIAQQESRRPRLIVGTFLGWRGKTLDVPSPLHFPTFWDRKATAEVVGNRSAEVFDRLEAIWAERRGPVDVDQLAPARLITIGHSFGADVVANALGHRLVLGLSAYKEAVEAERLGLTAPHPVKRVYGYGDLVVLINPAFEALQLGPARDLIADIAHFPPVQRPVMAVLTSDSDDAAGFWFHGGRLYRNLSESYRSRADNPIALDERAADQTGLGHDAQFLTMRLGLVKADPVIGTQETDSFRAWTAGEDSLQISRPVIQPCDQSERATSRLTLTAGEFSGAAPTPFLNVLVPKAIFDGHGLPVVSTPQEPSPQYDCLEDAIAGLVRLADYPIAGPNQKMRNQAMEAMSRPAPAALH